MGLQASRQRQVEVDPVVPSDARCPTPRSYDDKSLFNSTVWPILYAAKLKETATNWLWIPCSIEQAAEG